MNTQKTSGYGRLLAFFLIALALVLFFGFAASGNNPDKDKLNEGGGNTSDEGNDAESPGGKDDEGEDNEANAEPEPPKYFNYLTGLEESEAGSKRKPVCFVMNTEAALYGVSSAEILIEVPIENGKTRMLALTSSQTGLGKIGAIAPTRGYISGLAENFGSTLVSYGNDDTKVYPETITPPEHLDLTKYTGYHYTEYTKFAYSNADLINRGLENSSLGLHAPTARLPFDFIDLESDFKSVGASAAKITIPYSASGTTELNFSATDGTYTIAKGQTVVYDMLNGATPSFKNVIILYADSVTYESGDSVSFIMNTLGSGCGIYATNGVAVNIRWESNDSGEMVFFGENGERLSVNRGKTYVGFFKASIAESVNLQ